MKYVLFVCQPRDPAPEALSADEQQAIAIEYAELDWTPKLRTALPAGFPHKAVTVRVQDGQTVSLPGPYTDHPVGGYCEFEAASIEEAIRLAARIPAARLGGAVEVRLAERHQ